MKSPSEIIQHDVEFILSKISSLLLDLQDQHIFITGGTGFFGQWILDTLQAANQSSQLGLEVTVLTRNLANFTTYAGYLVSDPNFHFIEGDVRDFSFPDGHFPVIIHAATTRAEETFNNQDALKKYDTVAQGTRHLLDFAVKAKTKTILWTSSGAIYGAQPAHLESIPESYTGCPDPMNYEASALGLGKLSAEYLCSYYGNKHNIDIKIARCFSFVGPRMQMDIHYAVGNFISDIVNDQDIIIRGDGKPLRSFMYISDLIIWLFTILCKGKSLYPYNVGSDEAVSIAELAHTVARAGNHNTDVRILQPDSGDHVNRYLPNVSRAKKELGLACFTNLEKSVQKTINYESSRKKSW